MYHSESVIGAKSTHASVYASHFLLQKGAVVVKLSLRLLATVLVCFDLFVSHGIKVKVKS